MSGQHPSPTEDVEVVVVGAGFSGLAAGHQLRQAGIDSFVLLERAEQVGGTWRDNTYPGASCDVPSLLYSLSFAPKNDWSHTYSPQQEIQRYLVDCVHRLGLTEHLRLGHDLDSAVWDQQRARWLVSTGRGHFTARVLISAAGPLNDPVVPDLPGLADFTGTVFHSGQWNHQHDLRGRRIAVIGTGASAVQLVPQLQPQVAQLDLYQRTPAWVMPRRSRPFTRTEQRLLRTVPGLRRAVRTWLYWYRELLVNSFTGDSRPGRLLVRASTALARAHLRRQVPDARLRARLTPTYRFGCKRVLVSDDFYPALTQPNVATVTEPVGRIGPTAITTADGVRRPVDTIVLATGFAATRPPIARRITGRDGRTLDQAWAAGMHAYLGSTVPAFPNLFLVLGPNSGLGHSSITLVIEAQARYAVAAVRHLRRHRLATLEVTEEASAAHQRWLADRFRGSTWTTGGCHSWYLDPDTGRNTTLWPASVWRLRLMTRRFDPANYHRRHPDQVTLATTGAGGDRLETAVPKR